MIFSGQAAVLKLSILTFSPTFLSQIYFSSTVDPYRESGLLVLLLNELRDVLGRALSVVLDEDDVAQVPLWEGSAQHRGWRRRKDDQARVAQVQLVHALRVKLEREDEDELASQILPKQMSLAENVVNNLNPIYS